MTKEYSDRVLRILSLIRIGQDAFCRAADGIPSDPELQCKIDYVLKQLQQVQRCHEECAFLVRRLQEPPAQWDTLFQSERGGGA
jgi:hypothetical protein